MLLLMLPLSRFSRVRLCATPWTAAHQAPLSLGFSRQKHWSELPFPSPYDMLTTCQISKHITSLYSLNPHIDLLKHINYHPHLIDGETEKLKT